MEQVYRFNEFEIVAFFLVLLRLAAFVVVWPAFGVDTVPAPVKILFGFVLAVMIFPVVDWSKGQAGFESTQLIWMAVRETFIGLSIGFLARMFFYSIRIAGEMISVSIGLAGAQLFNPAMGGQVTPIDNFLYSLAILFFLAINGHHILLTGIFDSFRILPLGADLISMRAFADIGLFVQEIVTIGLKLSAPVMIAILLTNLVLGVLGKTVPQINVLITSLAVNIMIGLGVLILALPLMVWQMPDLLELTTTRLFQVVKQF